MKNNETSSCSELLAIISACVHDMKTPLTSIVGFTDAILDGTVEKEKQEHYLRVIRDEAERLSVICRELLDASKLESGAETYEMKPFDICECAKRIIISMEKQIESKNLDVIFHAPDKGVIASGDENSIKRVLYNIIDNAVKFSYEGGMLRICVSENEKTALVRIENEGDGMSSEEIENIFLPFYKKGKNSGSGLGLFIAKRIIDAHSGIIGAESSAGKTIFTVEINRG